MNDGPTWEQVKREAQTREDGTFIRYLKVFSALSESQANDALRTAERIAQKGGYISPEDVAIARGYVGRQRVADYRREFDSV